MLAGGAVSAEMLLAWAPGRSAIGKLLLAGALLSRTVLTEKPQGCIGKTLLAEKPQGCIGKMLLAEKPQGCIGKQQPAVRAQSSIGKH